MFDWLGGSALGQHSMTLGNSTNRANGQLTTCIGGYQDVKWRSFNSLGISKLF